MCPIPRFSAGWVGSKQALVSLPQHTAATRASQRDDMKVATGETRGMTPHQRLRPGRTL